ncbi:MAG: MATE family efflux transporter, partial [Streptococcus thermophilus]
MHETHSLRERFLVFFKIFVPILIYQFANFSAAFVDTTMTGQYDALHLAGVAMATSLWSPFFTFLTGIVSALVPIIGHHLGAGRQGYPGATYGTDKEEGQHRGEQRRVRRRVRVR